MIQIKNLRNQKPQYPYDVKVDRSSVLGNPFFMQFEEQRSQLPTTLKGSGLEKSGLLL